MKTCAGVRRRSTPLRVNRYWLLKIDPRRASFADRPTVRFMTVTFKGDPLACYQSSANRLTSYASRRALATVRPVSAR